MPDPNHLFARDTFVAEGKMVSERKKIIFFSGDMLHRVVRRGFIFCNVATLVVYPVEIEFTASHMSKIVLS